MTFNGASPTPFRQDLRAVSEGRSDTLDLRHDNHYGAARELPAAVRQLANLRTLRLTGSGVTELPGWLAELNLERIDARGCDLTTVPPMPWVSWALNAGTLRDLKTKIDPARVYGAAIGPHDSPDAIALLTRLVSQQRLTLDELAVEPSGLLPPAIAWENLADIEATLDELIAGSSAHLNAVSIVDCPLERVPASLRLLGRLTALRLSALLLSEVPDWLFEIPALSALDLSRNRLTRLPATVGRAGLLKDLDLSYNPIPEIPDGVWQLSGLESLDLWGCPVQQIPAGILRMRALVDLRLDESRPDLTLPPPEVTGRGLDAIRSYWAQEQTSGMDHLAEAKLLIVGEPGAGKTTLARKILDPGYRLNPQEGSTQGIGVLSWRFPSAIRVADSDGEHVLLPEFRVNIWDFGGQEIYHSTHQFFLTKRSVYVLVTDARREDTDFHYWLEVVNLLSDGSPLIIVQNRKQGRTQELDLRTLRQEYPNLVATLTVDLADNSGLAEVVSRVRHELESLQHIGTPLPKTWQNVRMALEADTREYITATEFFRICTSHGFTRETDMRQLGGFLHDLGICLYFQDDPVLNQTIVLKPQWGTGAVYRILDDAQVLSRKGAFGTDDLHRIWHEPIYEPVRNQLVRLMSKFALCFPVPGTDGQYVAPQLLPHIRPAYSWDESDTLTLRYQYEILPKGLVRRLIVELHDLIEEGAVWYSGAVFAYESGRAEVSEDYRRRLLSIRLASRDSRVMLALIDRELKKIHGSYPDVRFERWRPCGCGRCATAEEPELFSVRELKDFARSGDRIQCRKSRQLVDAAALLDELWQPEDTAGSRPGAGPGEVFVSYRWNGVADALVDEIQGKLAPRGLVVLRDCDVIGYRARIRQFMRRLGAGRAVIVILDDGYLRSKYCMFELTELAGRKNFTKSMFPIVLPGLDINDPMSRIKYIRYWEEKTAELEREMRTVRQQNLHGIREELDLYQKIRDTIARITDVIRDMNTLTLAGHRDNDFAELYRALIERIGD